MDRPKVSMYTDVKVWCAYVRTLEAEVERLTKEHVRLATENQTHEETLERVEGWRKDVRIAKARGGLFVYNGDGVLHRLDAILADEGASK